MDTDTHRHNRFVAKCNGRVFVGSAKKCAEQLTIMWVVCNFHFVLDCSGKLERPPYVL